MVVCVGRDEGFGASLRKLAQVRGVARNLRWLGQRDNVTNLLGCADIGLLVSHEEGFSNAVLEGMAIGVPMIVTNVGECGGRRRYGNRCSSAQTYGSGGCDGEAFDRPCTA